MIAATSVLRGPNREERPLARNEQTATPKVPAEINTPTAAADDPISIATSGIDTINALNATPTANATT